jgi:hypothetical protein
MKLPPKATKVSLPKPLAQWFGDIATIEQYRALIDSPVFQTAVATLKEAASPSSSAISTEANQNAMRLNWLAGYHDAFRDLQKLTKLPVKPTQTPQEWMHIPQ